MAIFLKLVSGAYLVLVWATFAGIVTTPPPTGTLSQGQLNTAALLIAVLLSIPAVALFAFGQVVADVRFIRNNARLQTEHLKAMRAYYEPQR